MRSLPPIVKNLLIINALMFAATFVMEKRGVDLEALLGLHFFLSDGFYPHQFLTYMFMHSNLEHIFFNMFALWMFGGIIEHTMGQKRFLIYYLACGLGAGICQEIAQYIHYLNLDIVQAMDPMSQDMVDAVYVATPHGVQLFSLSSYLNSWSCVGASGAVYAILLAFGMYFPNERMFIIPIPFPIKAKYLVVGYAVIELMSVLTRANDNVAHIAHLGGMIFGVVLILLWRRMDNRRNGGGTATYVTFDNYNRGY